MQLTAIELLRSFAGVADAVGVRWYLFGAQAVVIHGHPRLTADVDVTAELPPEKLGEFMSTMASEGFDLRVENPEEFVSRTRVLPFFHRRSALPVDVVLAGPGPEEEFLDRAVTVTLAGARIPVIRSEDLIVVKILAGRAKDLEDVKSVLRRQRGKLDLSAVRTTLRQLEQLLDQSDLTPLLESLVREAKR